LHDAGNMAALGDAGPVSLSVTSAMLSTLSVDLQDVIVLTWI